MIARRKARAVETTRIRAAGAEAFRRGRHRSTCPYPYCGSERGAWLGGYSDAEAASRRQGLTP